MDEILDETCGDFYMDIREFKNNSIEVVVKAIRPMQEGAIKASVNPDSYTSFCKANGLPSGYEPKKRYSDDDKEKSEFQKETNHHRSVRRSSQRVRHLIKQAEADRLFTLTTRSSIEDRSEFKALFNKFLRLVKKGWGGKPGIEGWRYVAVPEKQERGAYHVHCAVKGHQNVNYLRAAWHKALGFKTVQKGEDSPGNVDVTTPRKAKWGTEFSRWKVNKLAAYLTKYLSETFSEVDTEKRRFWQSADIEKPVKRRLILSAKDMAAAIIEAAGVLGWMYDYPLDFSQSWNAPTGDSIWFSMGGA